MFLKTVMKWKKLKLYEEISLLMYKMDRGRYFHSKLKITAARKQM